MPEKCASEEDIFYTRNIFQAKLPEKCASEEDKFYYEEHFWGKIGVIKLYLKFALIRTKL